jgi:uncharacterized membrane protein YhaH (DUF805 family)
LVLPGDQKRSPILETEKYFMNLMSLLFSFRGRVKRLQFWVVTLVLIGWGATFQQFMGPYGPENPMTIGPVIVTLANFFVVLWIWLAVQIKRWHDRDKSGWWAALNLIPVIGQVWILIECGFLPGTVGTNRFDRESTS